MPIHVTKEIHDADDLQSSCTEICFRPLGKIASCLSSTQGSLLTGTSSCKALKFHGKTDIHTDMIDMCNWMIDLQFMEKNFDQTTKKNIHWLFSQNIKELFSTESQFSSVN